MKLATRFLLVLATSLALAGWPQALATTSAEPSVAAAAAPAADAAAPAAERVIDRAITDLALALDADGRRHVAATTAKGGLWYATDRTGAWQAERILAAQPGLGWTAPSVATDDQGRVHIAVARVSLWDTPQSSDVWYLSDAGRSRGDFGPPEQVAWANMTGPSLKVEAGVRYLAFAECACYPEQTGTRLYFKTDRSGAWTRERVAMGATDPALRVASDGRAHIAFRYRDGVGHARARTVPGDFTAPRRIPGTAGKRGIPSLALDTANRPRVAWSDGQKVWYVERTASGWRSPRQLGKGHAAEISLDALGRPHVAFARNGSSPGGVVHRWRAAGAWKQQVLGRGARVIDVDIRAFGNGASVAWSQAAPLRGLWVAPAS